MKRGKQVIVVDKTELEPIQEDSSEDEASSSSIVDSNFADRDSSLKAYTEALSKTTRLPLELNHGPSRGLQRTKAFKSAPVDVLFDKKKSLRALAQDAVDYGRKSQLNMVNVLEQHRKLLMQGASLFEEIASYKIASLEAARNLAQMGGPITTSHNWKITIEAEEPGIKPSVADTSVYVQSVQELESRWDAVQATIRLLGEHETLLEDAAFHQEAEETSTCIDALMQALEWMSSHLVDDDALQVAESSVYKDESRRRGEARQCKEAIRAIRIKVNEWRRDLKIPCKAADRYE